MKKLSTAQLASYIGVTKRTIQRRVVRENWPYSEQTGLGGVRRMFEFATLPVDVRQKVVAHIIHKHEQQGLHYVPNKPVKPQKVGEFRLQDSPFFVWNKANSDSWLAQHCFVYPIDNSKFANIELAKNYVRAGLLVLARLYVASFALSKIKGFDQFCQLYNTREFALDDTVYREIGHVSRISLLRWEKQLNGSEHHGVNLNDDGVIFNWDLQQMAQEILTISPNITAKRLRQHFLTIFTNRKIPAERYLSSWLKKQNELLNH